MAGHRKSLRDAFEQLGLGRPEVHDARADALVMEDGGHLADLDRPEALVSALPSSRRTYDDR